MGKNRMFFSHLIVGWFHFIDLASVKLMNLVFSKLYIIVKFNPSHFKVIKAITSDNVLELYVL